MFKLFIFVHFKYRTIQVITLEVATNCVLDSYLEHPEILSILRLLHCLPLGVNQDKQTLKVEFC